MHSLYSKSKVIIYCCLLLVQSRTIYITYTHHVYYSFRSSYPIKLDDFFQKCITPNYFSSNGVSEDDNLVDPRTGTVRFLFISHLKCQCKLFSTRPTSSISKYAPIFSCHSYWIPSFILFFRAYVILSLYD